MDLKDRGAITEAEFLAKKREIFNSQEDVQWGQDQQETDTLAEERKERIAAYWALHSEEKKALLEKRAKAQALLNRVNKEQRDALQALIRSINHELTKDR